MTVIEAQGRMSVPGEQAVSARPVIGALQDVTVRTSVRFRQGFATWFGVVLRTDASMGVPPRGLPDGGAYRFDHSHRGNA